MYNNAFLDVDEDGEADLEDDACGDLPYLVHTKSISTPVQTSATTWEVTYTIVVENLGGAVGNYTLTNTPMFDPDIIINSAEYSTDATANSGSPGPLALAGVGPWTLSSSQAINGGGVQT